MSQFACEPWNWRMSWTEAGLENGSFYLWKTPPPSVANYVDHSDQRVTSDGRMTFHGSKILTMVWDVLSGEQMGQLRYIIDRTTDNVLYLTIDRGSGQAFGRDWIDIRGIVHDPVVTQQGPIDSKIGQPSYQNVQLFVNRITVLNDPSSHSS
jgi:hypothetical protein